MKSVDHRLTKSVIISSLAWNEITVAMYNKQSKHATCLQRFELYECKLSWYIPTVWICRRSNHNHSKLRGHNWNWITHTTSIWNWNHDNATSIYHRLALLQKCILITVLNLGLLSQDFNKSSCRSLHASNSPSIKFLKVILAHVKSSEDGTFWYKLMSSVS